MKILGLEIPDRRTQTDLPLYLAGDMLPQYFWELVKHHLFRIEEPRLTQITPLAIENDTGTLPWQRPPPTLKALSMVVLRCDS